MDGRTACASPRRRDAQRTRERLIDVARTHFAQHGYDGTSVRAIADDAGVAPNLITRYFGGKAGLFSAATTVELGVEELLPGPIDALGDRIAAAVVDRWERAPGHDPLLMMLRSAGTSEAAARTLADFFTRQASEPLVAHLSRELHLSAAAAHGRIAAVGALIMGTVMSRYVMRKGPIASADAAALERWLGDRLQRLLDDPGPPAL